MAYIRSATSHFITVYEASGDRRIGSDLFRDSAQPR